MSEKPALDDLEEQWREQTLIATYRRIHRSLKDIHALQEKGFNTERLMRAKTYLQDGLTEIRYEKGR